MSGSFRDEYREAALSTFGDMLRRRTLEFSVSERLKDRVVFRADADGVAVFLSFVPMPDFRVNLWIMDDRETMFSASLLRGELLAAFRGIGFLGEFLSACNGSCVRAGAPLEAPVVREWISRAVAASVNGSAVDGFEVAAALD